MASKSTPLPDKSNPEYYKNTDVSKQVKGNLKNPVMPTGAEQKYTRQQLQANELQSQSSMGAPTTVGGRSVTAPKLGAVGSATTSTIGGPAAITSGAYSANTAGQAATSAAQQAANLTKQVVAQTGSATQATAATDSTAMTGALAR